MYITVIIKSDILLFNCKTTNKFPKVVMPICLPVRVDKSVAPALKNGRKKVGIQSK